MKAGIQNGVDANIKFRYTVYEEQPGFYTRYLVVFIKTLRGLLNGRWTKVLKDKYLGY
jgi:hypothetical protein